MRRFLLLLITLLSTATFAFAEEVTVAIAANKFTADPSDSKIATFTSDGFTFTLDKDNSSTANRLSDSDHLRIYLSANFTVSSNNGQTITKMVITATENQYAKLAVLENNGSGSWSGTTYTWTGSSSSISFDATAQSRIKSITITYGTGSVKETLSFDKASVSLTLGDTFTAPTLKNADGLTINWESSNTDVATVDGTGYVEIKGIGTTKITATDATDNTNTASYTITVKDPNAIEHVLTTSVFSGTGTAYSVERSYESDGIVYDARFAVSNGIQLNKNTKGAYPGIVVTANPDGYILSKVIVEWNAKCPENVELEIYGSNVAYTGTSELNATAADAKVEKGELIGSLTSTTDTELDVTGDYSFIGIRALSTVNIDKITLVWVVPAPEFKADITIAVDETEGGANVVSFSNLAVSNGVEFDFTGYNVKLNGTEIGSAANGETLSYLPFLPSAAFTISNGTNTYPVVVNWPITDFSTIQAKVTGVKYWALQDTEHDVDGKNEMWYLDAEYTVDVNTEMDLAVEYEFEGNATGQGHVKSVNGNTAYVEGVGTFDAKDYLTDAAGDFMVTPKFPFFVKTALTGMKAPEGNTKVASVSGAPTMIEVEKVAEQPSAETGNISGVESVVVDSECAVEYYNLQGVRVEGALTPGIYIRRTATGTSKVAIR